MYLIASKLVKQRHQPTCSLYRSTTEQSIVAIDLVQQLTPGMHAIWLAHTCKTPFTVPPHEAEADALLDVRLLVDALAATVTVEKLDVRLVLDIEAVGDDSDDELGVELRDDDDGAELMPAVTVVV